MLYLDSSALVKLIAAEPESDSVAAAVADWPLHASSIVARIELGIAARRTGGGAVRRADRVLAALDLVALDKTVADVAATRFAPGLRALDAVHLASALALGDDLGAMLTFDRRQRTAAGRAGIPLLPLD